jgi:hypothetical protein
MHSPGQQQQNNNIPIKRAAPNKDPLPPGPRCLPSPVSPPRSLSFTFDNTFIFRLALRSYPIVVIVSKPTALRVASARFLPIIN